MKQEPCARTSLCKDRTMEKGQPCRLWLRIQKLISKLSPGNKCPGEGTAACSQSSHYLEGQDICSEGPCEGCQPLFSSPRCFVLLYVIQGYSVACLSPLPGIQESMFDLLSVLAMVAPCHHDLIPINNKVSASQINLYPKECFLLSASPSSFPN